MQKYGIEGNRWLWVFVEWTVKGQLALSEGARGQGAPAYETVFSPLQANPPRSQTPADHATRPRWGSASQVLGRED